MAMNSREFIRSFHHDFFLCLPLLRLCVRLYCTLAIGNLLAVTRVQTEVRCTFFSVSAAHVVDVVLRLIQFNVFT